MIQLTKDSATNELSFVLVDDSGNEVTGLGDTFVLTLKKKGESSFSASAGTKAETGNGWYRYTPTAGEVDTLGPLSAKVTGAGVIQQNLVYDVVDIGATVWTYASRSLTQAAAAVIAAVSGQDLTLYSAVYNSATLTGMATGIDIVEAWFSVKENVGAPDSKAWIRVSSLNGLERIWGQAVTLTPPLAADASLTCDENAGSATIVLKTTAMELIPAADNLVYDIVYEDSSGERHVWTVGGTVDIEGVVTHDD